MLQKFKTQNHGVPSPQFFLKEKMSLVTLGCIICIPPTNLSLSAKNVS